MRVYSYCGSSFHASLSVDTREDVGNLLRSLQQVGLGCVISLAPPRSVHIHWRCVCRDE